MNLNTLINANKRKFDIKFKKLLKNKLDKSSLSNAIFYGSMNGGKRIRPFLVMESAKIAKISSNDAFIIASCIECIHSYSLIHDDLPSMDDDDYRRGKLSTHKKFNEATAILAGDAIQPLALEILTTIKDEKLKPDQKLKIINLFAKACGPKGMVEGQSRDLAAEGKKINIKDLDEIHYLKTGKLIEACVESICILKDGLLKKDVNAFLNFARKFGLAFQIKDDILDILGDEKKIGKPLNSDSEKNKATYPAIIGLKASQERAEKLCFDALKILSKLPYNTENLVRLSKFIILRDK